MKDDFNVHEWRLKTQLKEYVATLKQTPNPPTREEIEDLWSDLSSHNEERANIISVSTAGRAGNIGKTEGWEILDPEVRGSIIGYFIANPEEFREYQGIVSNINTRPRATVANMGFKLN